MDLSWFKDLEKLARTGNFSQAAQLSNISQPAFSRRIKGLETWVGTKLVDRKRHPISLTTAGKQMLEASQQAFERLEYERAQILEAQSLPDRYVLTFGAQHSIGWRFFPAWLQAFENAYGPVISKLRAADLPSCIDALYQGEVDFVIAYESAYTKDRPTPQPTQSLSIGSDALIPVCKPGGDQRALFSFEDAEGPPVPFLRFGEDAPITQHIDPMLEQAAIRPRLTTVYENSMAGALRIRARDGAGVAWLPQSLVAPDIEAGLLVATGHKDWQIDLDIRMHRHKEHTNKFTRDIWAYLSTRERVPLLASI
ncbi:MAG: LysR family transcriptional regulator [Rhizobiaceae bacterium]